MTPEEKEYLLDRYVAGHLLSAEEETQIQELLAADPELRAGYRLRQTLLEAGIKQRRVAWAARQRSRQTANRPTFPPMRWVAAASVVLLLSLGVVWWTQRANDTEPIIGSVALYQSTDAQLGLAGNDTSAVGSVVWIVTKASKDSYEFSQLDTLRIFTPTPKRWTGQIWRLTSLSEVRYRLEVGKHTYLLRQGRAVRLPLESGQ